MCSPSSIQHVRRCFSIYDWKNRAITRGIGYHTNRQLNEETAVLSRQVRLQLRKAREDASEEAIDENSLYAYTRYRWLSNDRQKLALRYRKFNLGALIDAAISAVGHGANSCVKVLKCVEGQFNKAFVLTLDNGVEVFAKLPNPNAGPQRVVVASEVATRQFVRETLGIPIPRVLSWSSDPSNAVGAEYILEEKARGQPLGSLWYQWSKRNQIEFISQIVEIERKLASISFPTQGCIYYRADLNSEASQSLTPEVVTFDNSTTKMDTSILQRFAIGPSVDPNLWTGKRASMNLDRGPWGSALEHIKALGKNEIHWTESHAQPRMNYHRSMEDPEMPADYLSLLSKYMTIAPFLIPSGSSDLLCKTLSHPDLHLDNIFVDPESRIITDVIDWQSTSVREIFLQRHLPPMLPPEVEESNKDSMGPEGDSVRPVGAHSNDSEGDILHHYKRLTECSNSRRWAVLQYERLDILTKPILLVSGAWDREDVFSFRHALISVLAHWENLGLGSSTHPVEFSPDEFELHDMEMELIEGLGRIMHQLQDENVIPLGGMVPAEKYEWASKANDRFREEFIALAENDHQRDLHSKVWPYQDSEQRKALPSHEDQARQSIS